MEDGERLGRRSAYVHAGVLALVTALTFLRTRHIGLLGFDSYPIILTSRIRNWGDFVGTFTESLMDGRYAGDFYRPLVNLSCALDHALWGLDARGFQWTNALLFAGCLVAIHYLARRLAPGGPHWLVPFVFLLHPASADVTPVIARRAENLCCAFLALSAAAVVVGSARHQNRQGLAAAAFTVLAIGAKETGYLAPMLVGVAAWVSAVPLAPRARFAFAIRRAVPSGVAALGMLAVRWQVLGGLGGHETSGVSTASERILEVVVVIGQRLAAPDLGPQSWWGTVSIAAVLVALAALAGRSRREPAGEGRGSSALVIVGAAWLGLACLTYAGAGRVTPWYLLIPAAAWALIVVGVGGWLGLLVRAQTRLPRGLGAIGLVALALMVGSAAQYAPLLRDDPRWAEGTAVSEDFLGPLLASLESSVPGDVIEPGAVPRRVAGNRVGEHRVGVWVLADYSIQAWSELVVPERDPRVAVKGPSTPQAESGEVLIVLPPRPARKPKASRR